MTCQTMLSLGVYVLGAADADERRQVQAHLPTCRACQAELARIAPLPALLATVPPQMRPAPGIRPVTEEGPRHGRRNASRRRGAGAQWWRAPAVACVAAAAGVLTGFWLAPGGAAEPAAGILLTASNRASHVSATARLTPTTWGTSIELRLSGLPRNVVCRLIVRSRTGVTEVGGVWDAWRDGPIEVPGSVAWRPGGIASLEVVTATRKLVTLEAHRSAR